MSFNSDQIPFVIRPLLALLSLHLEWRYNKRLATGWIRFLSGLPNRVERSQNRLHLQNTRSNRYTLPYSPLKVLFITSFSCCLCFGRLKQSTLKFLLKAGSWSPWSFWWLSSICDVVSHKKGQFHDYSSHDYFSHETCFEDLTYSHNKAISPLHTSTLPFTQQEKKASMLLRYISSNDKEHLHALWC